MTDMTDSAGSASLRDRLARFGDPCETRQWETGEVDYVARLGLTAADVPELLATARQWAEPMDWPEDRGDTSGYAPIHAWRGLAQLGATEAIDLLLEMMDPLDADGDDWYLEEFPCAFAWLGETAIRPLAAYLAGKEHALYARICVADALRDVAKRHSRTRDDVVAVLRDALSRFAETDDALNAYIIGNLLVLKATEAAELIERAYAADRVDVSIYGNWNYAREELGVDGLGLVPEHLANKKWSWIAPSQADWKGEQPSFLNRLRSLPADHANRSVSPLGSSPKVGRNEPCPCGSGKKHKKCCGR